MMNTRNKNNDIERREKAIKQTAEYVDLSNQSASSRKKKSKLMGFLKINDNELPSRVR